MLAKYTIINWFSAILYFLEVLKDIDVELFDSEALSPVSD